MHRSNNKTGLRWSVNNVKEKRLTKKVRKTKITKDWSIY